ncbi:uncharacterized protein LOC118645711 [Monomorium pharaonis]|uniref:uncharacterized protein LOC118645711 n=1 Tax=Monomorium pharaonis TaxID=307658 RepID=UPI001747D072|nr:uncharacterized protein LOC118645711 [Monomorium pharaonis]
MSDTFCVVVTHEWVAAVPSTWVFPNVMMVWWPTPSLNGETITTAISKKREPEDTWNKINYQYLIGPFETYIEARKMEKRATSISTDDDTDAILKKFPLDENKRKRKANKRDDFMYTSGAAAAAVPPGHRQDPDRRTRTPSGK